MLAELSQGRSCGRVARGGRASVCRVEFSYLDSAAVETDLESVSWRGDGREGAGCRVSVRRVTVSDERERGGVTP